MREKCENEKEKFSPVFTCDLRGIYDIIRKEKATLEKIFTPKDDLDDDEPQSNKPLSKDIKKNMIIIIFSLMSKPKK